jgi:hypothetical protein
MLCAMDTQRVIGNQFGTAVLNNTVMSFADGTRGSFLNPNCLQSTNLILFR